MTLRNESEAASRVRSRVAWGAIFAGALVALACLLTLGALLAAIDYSAPAGSQSIASVIVAAMSLCSLFVGGLTTARLSAGENSSEAALYGVLTWSVTAIFLLFLAINGFSILGSATVLGQHGTDEFLPVSPAAAWWGFAGVLLSLIAALAGALAGYPQTTVSAAEARPARAQPKATADDRVPARP